MRFRLAGLHRIGLLVIAVGMLDVHASTYFVTRNDDPAPDGCAPDDCSLREAVSAANAHLGVEDTIQLGSESYGLPGGGLIYKEALRILGAGMDATTIEGDGENSVLRADVGAALYLDGVTIESHHAHSIDYSMNAATTLHRVRTTYDSQIWSISNISNGAPGQLSVSDSELRAYVDARDIVTIDIRDSRLANLQTGEGWVGLHSNVALARTTFDGDYTPGALTGLGLQVTGSVSISHCVFTHTDGLRIYEPPFALSIDRLRYIDNTGPVYVGAAATVQISDSEFRGNANTQFSDGPGALYVGDPDAHVLVIGSTFSTNTGNGDAGGAVLVEQGGSVSIQNSTFSGNNFSVEAAAGGARGAAIGYRDDPAVTALSLAHVTIVAPTTTPVGVTGTAIGGYGSNNTLLLTVANSIVRGSCALGAGSFDTALGNLEGSGDTCGFDQATNLVGVASSALALGALGNHGGPTPTYLPGSSSLAIGAADDDYCGDIDQRGYPRPAGATCDSGAVEADSDVVFADGFE
jgi:hypothetical protein